VPGYGRLYWQVIANRMVELSTGEWILPFWRQRSYQVSGKLLLLLLVVVSMVVVVVVVLLLVV
jgi:hypothetical protein